MRADAAIVMIETLPVTAEMRHVLLTTPTEAAIGAAARQAVSEYDLDLIATRYAELCRSLWAGNSNLNTHR